MADPVGGPGLTTLPDRLIDLLIVGAGPAGMAAAIEARDLGLDALAIDKATFPRDKCCGDGLTTGALRQLDELGLDPSTIPSWKLVDRFTLRAPSGKQHQFPLPADGSFAAVARRSELDAALVDLARTAGATVAEHTELLSLETSAGEPARATVRADDGQPVTITARSVIAADGMWSPTRKLLDWDGPPYLGEWHAFRQYFTEVDGPAADELLVWFEPDLLPGYAWSFPLADGQVNVGFGILRTTQRPVQHMKQLWPELLARPHIVAALGQTARPAEPHRAWPIPARLGQLPVVLGPVLFVGDALAAADPMTGEGIGQAIETGRAAVAAIADHPGDRAAAGRQYQSELRRGMGRDHRLARSLGRILASPRAANAALATCGLTAWTRRNFARWLFEDYPRATLVTPHRWHRRVFSAAGAFRPGPN